MTAPALILHLLTYVRAVQVDWLARYFDKEWGIAPATTHNTLWRLAREGKICRVGYGRYAVGERTPTALEQCRRPRPYPTQDRT